MLLLWEVGMGEGIGGEVEEGVGAVVVVVDVLVVMVVGVEDEEEGGAEVVEGDSMVMEG